MYVPNLKFVALRVPETIGGTHKIWAVPGYANTLFPPKFFMDPVSVSAKFAVRSFTRS